jgi:metallo-beta-lactamase class B
MRMMEGRIYTRSRPPSPVEIVTFASPAGGLRAIAHGIDGPYPDGQTARKNKTRGAAMKRLFPALMGLFTAMAAMLAFSTVPAAAAASDFLTPYPPVHIIGNVYFVGSKDRGSDLITTPQGNILINPDFDANVPMIKDSIEKLGFKYADTKILLISHSHSDHDAGAARLIKETGARYEVMAQDVPVVESGGKTDFQYGNTPKGLYAPAKVDRVLHDGDKVELGGTVLTARLTPGHTPGCTTWTMTTTDAGKPYRVVFYCSTTVVDRLLGNTSYPSIVADYERSFPVLRELPSDVFLAPHPAQFNMLERRERATVGSNPFIDPTELRRYVDQSEKQFREALAKEKAAAAPAAPPK